MYLSAILAIRVGHEDNLGSNKIHEERTFAVTAVHDAANQTLVKARTELDQAMINHACNPIRHAKCLHYFPSRSRKKSLAVAVSFEYAVKVRPYHKPHDDDGSLNRIFLSSVPSFCISLDSSLKVPSRLALILAGVLLFGITE